MKIGLQLPGGYVTFCDDIREEVGNKATLVGCYTGEMVIAGDLPTTITQICAQIVYRDDPRTFPKDVTLKMVRQVSGSDEDETMFEATIPMTAAAAMPPTKTDLDRPGDPPPFVEARMNCKFGGLVFERLTRLKVRAYVAGEEIRLGVLTVRSQPADDAQSIAHVSRPFN